ncbi:MAG: hypothetical protein K6F68_03400, partial [Clostridiales bacterium]|nr:hypothetical protein [Clostridiales bacterium]
MKKRIKGIACLLIACLILVASVCVKTPEGEAVAAKTKIDGLHVGEVKSEDGTPTPQELGQPEHITESWTQALGDPDFGGAGTHQRLDYTVNIDADVIVPAGGIFPVYGVAKAKYMDEDLFDRFVNVLFEGCEGKYCAPDGRSYEKGCFDSDDRLVDSPCYVNGANIEHDLYLLQGKAGIYSDEDYSYREYLLFAASENRTLSTNHGAAGGDVIGLPDYVFDYYGEGGMYEGIEGVEPVERELRRNETSPEDALKIAEEFLSKVGLSDTLTLAYSGKSRLNTTLPTMSYEAMGFAFVPKVGNARMAPIDIDDTVSTARLKYRNTSSGMDFGALWLPNVLRIYVYNGRILYLHWTSCTSDNNDGVSSRNAPLKPFSEIYETFKAKLDLAGNVPP